MRESQTRRAPPRPNKTSLSRTRKGPLGTRKTSARRKRSRPRQLDWLDGFTLVPDGVSIVAPRQALAHLRKKYFTASDVIAIAVENLLSLIGTRPLMTSGAGRPRCDSWPGCPHPGCIQLRNEQRHAARALLEMRRSAFFKIPLLMQTRVVDLARSIDEI